MTKLHLYLGLIIVAGTILIGIFTAQLTILEGLLIAAIIGALIPFIWKLIKKTPKHDDR